MSRTYLPPHYSVVGIRLMGEMFEHQVRIAQALGSAAMVGNPLFYNGPTGAAIRMASGLPPTPRLQDAARRHHSMPV